MPPIGVPLGMAVAPATMIDSPSVPRIASSTLLVFEASGVTSVTRIGVPAGIVTSRDVATGAAGELVDAEEVASAPDGCPVLPLAVAAGGCAVSALPVADCCVGSPLEHAVIARAKTNASVKLV